MVCPLECRRTCWVETGNGKVTQVWCRETVREICKTVAASGSQGDVRLVVPREVDPMDSRRLHTRPYALLKCLRACVVYQSPGTSELAVGRGINKFYSADVGFCCRCTGRASGLTTFAPKCVFNITRAVNGIVHCAVLTLRSCLSSSTAEETFPVAPHACATGELSTGIPTMNLTVLDEANVQ